MHRNMNSSAGFSPSQAGELVAGLALLPENSPIRYHTKRRHAQSFCLVEGRLSGETS